MVFHFVVIIQLDCDLLYQNIKFKKREAENINKEKEEKNSLEGIMQY